MGYALIQDVSYFTNIHLFILLVVMQEIKIMQIILGRVNSSTYHLEQLFYAVKWNTRSEKPYCRERLSAF